MMTTHKEFYYDDLVISIDDSQRKCSIGLVTKEKPFSPTFLKKLNSKDLLKVDNDKLEDSKPSPPDLIINSYESDDDDDSLSEGNLYDKPQKENVNVNWFIHKHISEMSDLYDKTYIESMPGSSLQLFDRNLEMSDIVKLNVDGKTKVGTVFNVKMVADAMILGLNKIIRNVDCTRMKWIEPFMGKNLETNYTYDSWLGEVMETSLEVIIRFADGAKMKVPDTLLNQFDNKISSIWSPDIILEGCVMEGDAQDLKSRKAKFLTETVKHNSKWLFKLKQEEIVQVLVEKISTLSADMQWVFGYNNQNGIVPESPLHTIKGKELEKLEAVHPYPWHCLTVGDVWYYELSADDKILELEPEEDIDSVMYKLINGEINNCPEFVASDVDTNEKHLTTNKIVDNQISSGFVIKPRKKILCNIKTRNKRKPLSVVNAKSDQYTSDESTDSDNNEQNIQSGNKCFNNNEKQDSATGKSNSLDILTKLAMNRIKPNHMVPVGILLTKCIVDVNWQDGTVNYNIPSTKLIPQIYNIDEHEFFPGDFVVQKFDSLNPNPEKTMHNFGTVISANSKDRIAKVQWFDYVCGEVSKNNVIKAEESVEVGVYDISALNEHHFVLGQEVIIKQEVAHKNYPAGYVTRLEPNDGLLVIRWPDGEEISMSPTDLLLTVESAIGGGSGLSDKSDLNLSDDLSSDLHSESDTTDWETVEEIETTQSDESYLSKLICARKDLCELLDTIKKIETTMNSVSEFTQILQASLPPHISQMLNGRDVFKNEIETIKLNDENLNISFSEQQMAFRTLFEIRQNLGLIYKQCNDVGIKRMFECYRPKEFLSFRNIKNFIVSNSKLNEDSKEFYSLENISDLKDTKDNIPNGSAVSSESNSKGNLQTVVGGYLLTQYQNIRTHLQYLQESIEVWLEEKSCYHEHGNINTVDSRDVTTDTMEPPIVNLNGDVQLDPVFNDTTLAQQSVILSQEENYLPTSPVDPKSDSFDRTMSTCEPIPDAHRGQFVMIETAPSSHKFINSSRPTFSNPKFSKAWKRDVNLLSTSLPLGVIVKSFDDRADLFSVMIVGPSGTPYQHALFFFDIQLGLQYPTEPPSVFYISLTSERVNPNLYTEGRVCLSLLGTWNGKGTENWDSKVSSLLQLIVSLQGLILVSEPYYNEAGFEIRKGSEEGKENSQRYNENTINNISLSMINLLHKPIPVFETEINEHFKEFGNSLISIHDFWSNLNEETLKSNQLILPDFPLAPVSKGFHLSIQRNLNCLKKTLTEKIFKI